MDLQNLKKFFEDKLRAEELAAQIAAEVESFRTELFKKGSSARVRGFNENFRYSFGNKDVKKLCDAFLKGILNEWHLNYLSNLLEMSPSFSFESDEIENIVFQLSSPEVDSSTTLESVKRICDNL